MCANVNLTFLLEFSGQLLVIILDIFFIKKIEVVQLLLGSGSPVGPAHIVDCQVTATTYTATATSFALAVNPSGAGSTPPAVTDIAAFGTLGSGDSGGGDGGAVLVMPRAVDFVIVGFPKTGTSSLWFNLGTVARVSMYSTEPADWQEIVRWRLSSCPYFNSSSSSSTTTAATIKATMPSTSSINAERSIGVGAAEAQTRGPGGACGRMSVAENDEAGTSAEAGAVGKGVENAGNNKRNASLSSASLLSPLLRASLGMKEREKQLMGFKCSKAIYDPRWIFATCVPQSRPPDSPPCPFICVHLKHREAVFNDVHHYINHTI